MIADIARGLRALAAPAAFIAGCIFTLRLPGLNAGESIVTIVTALGVGITFGRSLAKKLGDPRVADDALNASMLTAPLIIPVVVALWALPWYRALLVLPEPFRLTITFVPIVALFFAPWIYARVRWAIRDCRPAGMRSTQLRS